MANNPQAGGGNSMAALLGNMQKAPGQQQPQGNYGAGMQPSMMRPQNPNLMGGAMGNYQAPAQQPIPPGGAGYPQMSPDAMQNMMGQISSLQQSGKLGQAGTGTALGQPGGAQPSFGGPAAGGAPPKGGGNPQMKQAIAGLPGGPAMGQRPGMRPRPQGMGPANQAMRR